MTVARQILIGTALLCLSALVHVAMLLGSADVLIALFGPQRGSESGVLWSFVVVTGFASVVVAHAVQISIWATVLRVLGALKTTEEAIYYTLVTCTTLGYGDITLPRPWRILGAMAAVTGLLVFSLSTAFLIEVFRGLAEPR